MKHVIGAYEAKTRLPELLRQVRAGRRFTITNRGQAVAELVPCEEAADREPREAIEHFRAFLRRNPVKQHASVRELIVEGRA